MNFEFSTEEQQFQTEVRLWMAGHAPRDSSVPNLGIPADHGLNVVWERALASKGWLAYSWPKEYGGPGWTLTQRYIFNTERALAGCPPISPFGVQMLGPVLMAYGTQVQKDRYLPAIAKGEESWCQGFSEPQAGSDLAALKTQAIRNGDRYIVTGQKIWTTHAHWADFIFCLVRTNSDVSKQKGVSFLLIDIKSPGIEIRPIETIDGHHHLNEVFFTDVEVPVENLVGEEGQGWTIAKYLLTHERTGIAGVAESQYSIRQLLHAVTQDATLSQDSCVRRHIRRLQVDLLALEYTNLRLLDRLSRGGEVSVEPSMLKIKGSELQQEIAQAQMDFGALDAVPWLTDVAGSVPVYRLATQRYNFLRAASIYGGSNEIQKNLIAKQLGAQR